MTTPLPGLESFARTKKRCPRCGETKPLTEYYRDKQTSDGLCTYCMPCKNATIREHREKYPERFAAMARARARKHRRRKEYGLSHDDFVRLVELYESCCGICGIAVEDDAEVHDQRLVVDHDHKTGKVRGILCDACNTGLGRFKDDPAVLVAAANYLLKAGESDPCK